MIDPMSIALEQIDPHPHLFKINAGIRSKEGYFDFVKPKDEYFFEFDQDLQGSCTFNEIMWFWDQADFNPKVEKVKVYCTTFNKLFESIGLTTIDYLKLDTEGNDLDILQSIDYNKFNITTIRTEHSGDLSYKNQLIYILENNGYFIEEFEYDLIALKV